MPTKIKPSLRPLSSGRNAHAKESCISLAHEFEKNRLWMKTNHEKRRNDPVHDNAKSDLNPERFLTK